MIVIIVIAIAITIIWPIAKVTRKKNRETSASENGSWSRKYFHFIQLKHAIHLFVKKRLKIGFMGVICKKL